MAALASTYTFSEGVTSARAATERCRSTEELLTWGDCEGGYLMDYDNKHAIVFGLPEMPDAEHCPDAALMMYQDVSAALAKSYKNYLQLVAVNWPGWTLVWDDRGVDAFAEYLKRRGIDDLDLPEPEYPRTLTPAVTIVAPKE